jgi:hypothetical protein
MKTYEVELKRTSYVTVTVEANSIAEAEDLAWREVDAEPEFWEINFVEELT